MTKEQRYAHLRQLNHLPLLMLLMSLYQPTASFTPSAHCKSSMFGSSVTIPISRGRLALGTWQGVWLCEHRDRASGRRLVVTMQGE